MQDQLTLKQYEKRIIIKSLIVNYGHMTRTAKMLGISRVTLYRKVNQFQIDPKEFRRYEAPNG